MTDYIKLVKEEIRRNYPNIELLIEKVPETDDIFISICDEEIYNSDEYQYLVLNIQEKSLWNQGIFNFYFSFDKKECCNDQLTYEDLVNSYPYVFYNFSQDPLVAPNSYYDLNHTYQEVA